MARSGGPGLAPLPLVTRATAILIASLVWTALVGIALALQMVRDARPGDAGASPRCWPRETTLPRDPEGVTLVFLAHPRCPCTPASLEELRAVLEAAPGRVRAHVLVVRPAGARPGFEEGAVWAKARSIPGVVPLLDREGAEAARFGARTSGHVAAYDRHGLLVYAGGITRAKGHAGDNPGRRALLAAIGGRSALPGAVFGCPLTAPITDRKGS